MKWLYLISGLRLNLSVYPRNNSTKELSLLNAGGGMNYQSTFGYGDKFSLSPFNWNLSGQLTINIKKWAIPFTGSYSNKTFSYTHPFNKICLSPSYKWVKLQGGHCSMNWSPLLLSGETFLGGSVDLSPGTWKFSAFHGKFQKLNYGNGVSIGYSKNKLAITFSGFQLKNNLAAVFCANIPINTRWSFNFDQSISNFKGESSTSARKAGISWKSKQQSLFLDYQKIDPYYHTLGSPFIPNDEQCIQLKLQGAYKGKMNLGYTATGMQKGISHGRIQQSKRAAQSFLANYKWKNGIGLHLNLGNTITQSFRTMESSSENIYQMNSVVSTKFSYQRSRKSSSMNTSVSIQHNHGTDLKQSQRSQQSGQFLLSYKMLATNQFSLIVNRIQSGSNEIIGLSSGISHSRKIKKLNYSVSSLVNFSDLKKLRPPLRLQEKVQLTYTIGKKPSINAGLNLAFVQSIGNEHSANTQSMQGQLNISTTF